jgi:hypothetical protein
MNLKGIVLDISIDICVKYNTQHFVFDNSFQFKLFTPPASSHPLPLHPEIICQ